MLSEGKEARDLAGLDETQETETESYRKVEIRHEFTDSNHFVQFKNVLSLNANTEKCLCELFPEPNGHTAIQMHFSTYNCK